MARGTNSYIRKSWYIHVMRLPDCFYCGATEGSFQCDHIVPPQKGGLPRLENFTKACASCNASKGDRLLSDWLAHCFKKREHVYRVALKYLNRCYWAKKRNSDIITLNDLKDRIYIARKEHSIWTYRISKIKLLMELYG